MELIKTIITDDLSIQIFKSVDGFIVRKVEIKEEEVFSTEEKLLEIYSDDIETNDLK